MSSSDDRTGTLVTGSLPDSVDVLIVGAGPTGLALAVALARAGVDHLIVDRVNDLGADPRASLLHVRSIELLAGLGVGDEVGELGESITRASYYDAGLRVCDLDFTALESPAGGALGISQAAIEAILTDQLEAAGGAVHRPVALDSFELTDGGVSAQLSSHDLPPVPLSTRFIIGCDGMTSTVREHARLGGADDELPESFVTATVQLSGDLDRSAVHFFAADDGFLVLSPLPASTWRLTATMVGDGAAPRPEQLQLILTDRGPRTTAVTLGRPIDIGRYRVRRSVARHHRDGPVMLAGDAAHTFSPAGGQGMNTGLADATNLGWKLAAVCNRHADTTLLDTYATERRSAADDAVDRVDRFGGILSIHNPIVRGFRDAVAALAGRIDTFGAPVLRGLSGFDTAYERGAVWAGQGGDHRWGAIGERSALVDPATLADGAHHVLVADFEQVTDFEQLTEVFPAPLTVDVVPGAAQGACLVRPDGHIGWTGGADDVAALGTHLDRWFLRT